MGSHEIITRPSMATCKMMPSTSTNLSQKLVHFWFPNAIDFS